MNKYPAAGDLTQLVECLLSITLSAISSTTQIQQGSVCLQSQLLGDKGRRMRNSILRPVQATGDLPQE